MTLFKQLLALFIILALMVVASMFVKNIILSGVYQTNLHSAPALAGVLSQSLVTPQSKDVLPAVGKDFKIDSTNSLDNGQWMVVVVTTIADNENAVLVLQKLNGSYQVVLGPGTIFSSEDVQYMPADVINYLSSKDLIDNATSS